MFFSVSKISTYLRLERDFFFFVSIPTLKYLNNEQWVVQKINPVHTISSHGWSISSWVEKRGDSGKYFI